MKIRITIAILFSLLILYYAGELPRRGTGQQSLLMNVGIAEAQTCCPVGEGKVVGSCLDNPTDGPVLCWGQATAAAEDQRKEWSMPDSAGPCVFVQNKGDLRL